MALVRFVAGAQAQSEAPDGPTVLSPWPSEATAKAAAIERLREAVGSRSKSDNAADALGSAASAMVEREAPGAPQAVKDEAVIRLAGYWAQSDFGGIESETSVGGKVVSYFRPPASAFRYSGAKGLLAMWRIRRAGIIG